MGLLNLIAGILDLGSRRELLLDAAGADEAGQKVQAAGLVVGARGAGAAERLLADDGSRALAVDVKVAGAVAQGVLGVDDGVAVRREDGAREAVLARAVDGLANVGKGLGRVYRHVVVDVGDEDGAEQLGGEELVVGRLGLVDGRVDKVALAAVVLAAGEEGELRVALGGVNDARQLVEAGLVDDGADEILRGKGLANLEGLDLGDHLGLELGPDGLGDVEAAGGAALLALVLERAADGLDGGIVHVGAGVDQMEVLAARLAYNARVAAVAALGGALTDGAVQLAEDGGAARVVQGGELLVGQHGLGDLLGRAGDELDHVLGQAGLDQDLVQQPVGGNGRVGRLPDNDVAEQGGGARQVSGNGGEVEGRDGVDEALERTVLDAVPDARGVVGRLLGVELLGEGDVEAEEIAQLGGRVDLGLPGVLALADHGGGHDVVAVLARDQVGGLEEDGGAVGKGQGGPSLPGGEGRLNGLVDMLGGREGVGGDGLGVVGGVELLGGLRCLDLFSKSQYLSYQAFSQVRTTYLLSAND